MAEARVPRNRAGREPGNRIAIFWLELGYLIALAVLAWAYFTPAAPDWLRAPGSFGVIPSGVLWFGALGGVLISLVGVHEHRYHWDSRYWTWYIVRPFIGAAVGLVAVIIVMAGILAIGVEPVPTAPASEGPAVPPATPVADTKNMFYFLVAFVVGYREMHFRDLIKRLGDVLFTTREKASTADILDIEPDEGPAAGGTAIRITGSGFDGVSAVRFGAAEAAFQEVSDAQLDATTPPGVGTVSVTVVTSKGTITGGEFTYR
jgi:hypothetical protein